MAFGNFTLASAVADFGLTVHSQPLFPHVPPVDIGPGLRYALDSFGQLAVGINTEKARSEWLIASLFGELWNRGRGTLFVLSGVDFTVDKEAGLSGVVDFMVGRGPQLSFVLSPSCPILAVVEAKNESIPGGQGAVRGRDGGRPAVQPNRQDRHRDGVRRGDDGNDVEIPPPDRDGAGHRHPRVPDLGSRSDPRHPVARRRPEPGARAVTPADATCWTMIRDAAGGVELAGTPGGTHVRNRYRRAGPTRGVRDLRVRAPTGGRVPVATSTRPPPTRPE